MSALVVFAQSFKKKQEEFLDEIKQISNEKNDLSEKIMQHLNLTPSSDS